MHTLGLGLGGGDCMFEAAAFGEAHVVDALESEGLEVVDLELVALGGAAVGLAAGEVAVAEQQPVDVAGHGGEVD